jgi:thioredoxin 1
MDAVTTEQNLKDIKKDIIVVDFYAEWCNPCKMLSPIMEELATEYKDNPKVKIVKVNVGKSPQLAEKYDIISIPTILFITKAGNDFLPGFISKQTIIDKITSLLE